MIFAQVLCLVVVLFASYAACSPLYPCGCPREFRASQAAEHAAAAQGQLMHARGLEEGHSHFKKYDERLCQHGQSRERGCGESHLSVSPGSSLLPYSRYGYEPLWRGYYDTYLPTYGLSSLGAGHPPGCGCGCGRI